MSKFKTQHLLARDYKFIATSPVFVEMGKMYDDMDINNMEQTRAQLAAINAEQLKMAEADPIQPNNKYVAPAAGLQPAVDLYTFLPSEKQDKYPVIYFVHASGYLTGNARQQNKLLVELANQTGAAVVSVEYRMAGEAPYPADIDDAYHGLAYVMTHAHEMGLDKDRVVVMGESAGGGLAARLVLKVRDKGEFSLKGQVLVCPMLDYRTGSDQDVYNNPFSGEFIWSRKSNQLGWQMLRAGQEIPQEEMPYYSASMATDMSGLPRTFIAVGSLDLFVNENLDYASRLITAGVPTDLLVLNGVAHGIEVVSYDSPEAQRYMNARAEIVKTMFSE